MVSVKSFSISSKKNKFTLTLFCLSPRGKERIITLHFSFPVFEHFALALKKAVEKYKKNIPLEEEIKYIG